MSDLACEYLEHTFDYANHASQRPGARKVDIETTKCSLYDVPARQRNFTKKYENTDKIGVSDVLTNSEIQRILK